MRSVAGFLAIWGFVNFLSFMYGLCFGMGIHGRLYLSNLPMVLTGAIVAIFCIGAAVWSGLDYNARFRHFHGGLVIDDWIAVVALGFILPALVGFLPMFCGVWEL